MKPALATGALVTCALLVAPALRAEEEKVLVIESGRTVSLEYTLTLDDGSTADSNVGGEPLVYRHGQQEILPALERALAGLKVNDTKTVDIAAADGYGLVNQELFREVPPEKIPPEARKPGTLLMSEDAQGHRRPVRVHQVEPERIVVDLNHPLAGQALHFRVKVLAIQ